MARPACASRYLEWLRDETVRLAAAFVAAAGGLSFALGGAPGPAAAAPAAPTRAGGGVTDRAVTSTAGWRVAYQSTSTPSNRVNGVTALSRSDAWAVGARAGSAGLQSEPLVLQWNGQRWRSVTVPGLTGVLPA